jgi:PhnB protein
MATTVSPYLNFNGQCREAMTFYQACIGGELTLQRVAESPMAAQLPPGKETEILHSVLTHDLIVLMGSDMMGSGLIKGNSIGLCLQGNSESEIHFYFNNLATGGQIRMPLHQTFWGAIYGELTDKFGVNWVFYYTKS